MRYCRSRSFKVIEVGANRKPIFDFLLAFRCNYTPIFCSFRDITMYSLKNLRFFAILPSPISSPCKGVRSLGTMVWKLVTYKKTAVRGHSTVKTAWSYTSLVLWVNIQSVWQTDGDGVTPHIATSRWSVTERDKQQAQLSQRDRATLRVIEYFAKSPKVTQGHSK